MKQQFVEPSLIHTNLQKHWSKHLICAYALRSCAIARSLTLPLAFPGGNPSTKLLASNAMSKSSIEI
jgi:hypothetical protein